MRLPMSVLAGVIGIAGVAKGMDMGAMPGEERFAAIAGDGTNSAGAGLGVAGIDEDFFLQVTVRTELNLGKIGLGLAIPLNLRVIDKDPKNENDFYGIVRREDWDEPSEYLKVIRHVRLGHKRDPFYLRVGDLAADIGHGTIMSRYLNNIDVNTRRIGTQFDLNSNYGGFETMVGDVGAWVLETPESRVVAFRGYLKPFALVDAESFLNIFSLGFTVASDTNAPYTFEMEDVLDDAGNVVGQRPRVAKDNLVVDQAKAATVYGVDFEVQLLHTAILDLVPYTDLNFIDDAGWGWHAGILATAKMPIGLDLTIPVRLEYRRFKQNYVPMYFSTFYEVERYAYGGSSTPKYAAFTAADDEDGISGYYGDLAFDFAGIFQVGAFYEDYEGGDPNLAVFLSVPALDIFKLKAYYERHRIEGTDDIFKFDDRSMAVAQAQYELFPYVYLLARFSRRWELDKADGSNTYGEFVAVDDWNFGFEASFDF